MRHSALLLPLAGLLLLGACSVSPHRYDGPPHRGPHPYYCRPLQERLPWFHPRQAEGRAGAPAGSKPPRRLLTAVFSLLDCF